MYELLVLVLFFGLVFALMAMFYFRMIAIRHGTQSRLETDPEQPPPITPYVDETRGEDGLVYARSLNFDPSLASADKRAAELPDINQTLQGKR